MSHSYRKEKKTVPAHRNQVAREMVIERIGNVAGSKPMTPRSKKRTNNPRKNWNNEDFGDD